MRRRREPIFWRAIERKYSYNKDIALFMDWVRDNSNEYPYLRCLEIAPECEIDYRDRIIRINQSKPIVKLAYSIGGYHGIFLSFERSISQYVILRIEFMGRPYIFARCPSWIVAASVLKAFLQGRILRQRGYPILIPVCISEICKLKEQRDGQGNKVSK